MCGYFLQTCSRRNYKCEYSSPYNIKAQKKGSAFSFTSELDGGGQSTPRSGRFTPG
jgi:arginyl-tRNA--protein-N-Asp/Glu arginylyltransferase